MCGDAFGYSARRGPGNLCGGERAVALKLREIGAIGNLRHAEQRIEPFFGEGAPGDRRQFGEKRCHG
jgi:hypothetical protein